MAYLESNFLHMEIIQANLSHLFIVAPLFNEYRVFYKQDSALELAVSFLKERLTNGDSVIFLAMEGELCLGFTQLYPAFSSVSLQRLYILNDLFVLPDTRGKGVGQTLLEHAQQYTANLGYKGLALETATDNPAQHLYERLGWAKDDGALHYFWKC